MTTQYPTERLLGQSSSASTGKAVAMPHIEAGLALVTMTFDDLLHFAGYVCTMRAFEPANGDDEDEDDEEEEEKKKEKDEEDEDDEDEDEDAIQRLQVTGGLRVCAPRPFPDRPGDSRPGRHSH